MNQEQGTEWHTGFPERKGMYQCRIDGEEMELYYFICEMNRKKRYWTFPNGDLVIDPVEWMG